MTVQEQRAENLYTGLVILSYFLFILGGLFGYYFYDFYGLVLFGALGYLGGVWMRRSLGIRSGSPNNAFFRRMRERAQGSRPGLLEALVEKVSGKVFTQAQCRAVTQTYEKHVKQLKQAKSPQEQNRILADLDQSVKRILDV